MRFFPVDIPFFNSLRTLLFLAVSLLVIFTGTIVSQIVIQNYSTTLLAGAAAKGENTAHKLALDLTDKILINDLVAVQKAGVVRLGISEAPFRSRIRDLGIRMTLITAGVLAMVLVLSHLLISRLVRPLMVLTDTVKHMDEKRLDTRLDCAGPVEVTRLAAAYNTMLEKIAGYTDQLKRSNEKLARKNTDLDRVHHQMMTTFSVARELAALPDLKAIGSYLVETLADIVACQHLTLLIFDHEQKIPYLIRGKDLLPLDKEGFDRLHAAACRPESPVFLKKTEITALLLPFEISASSRMAVFPFHHHQQVLGAVLISCPEDCVCVKTEMDVIHLILEQASGAVFRASEHEREIQWLKKKTDRTSGYRGMKGKDTKIQEVYKLIEDVAPTDATVLIQGESGTGKEMVAQALHEASHRAGHPFVVINCSAYPATLLESELFGHEKGAFTGAVQRKIGKFEQAGGGTVFLDEIGEISMSAQTMLLRVLQSQKIERIGGTSAIKVNIRIVAATNRQLEEEVKNGNFREGPCWPPIFSKSLPLNSKNPLKGSIRKPCACWLPMTGPAISVNWKTALNMPSPWPNQTPFLPGTCPPAC
ncbi:MAG: sigma 54-interacting transcriptional regulator [Desulfobacteraceae bacterium]|nr:sigma 54-interacting transcriptional regulator [Desulfobacteraceae bacterium]